MLSARLARRLWGRESLDHLAVRGVRSLALRPRASLGDGISRSLFCADQLPRRGFSSGPPQPTVREFNPNGSMRPESTRLFYFVSPDTRTLMKHIEVQDPNSRYVILYGPSQSGKTTRMFYFMRQLATIDPNYLPVFVDMSTLKNVTSQALWAAMTLELPAGEPVPCIHDENEFLKWVLSVHERGKKLVLFFDEADAFLMYAPKETRSNFLTTLRAAKAYRNGPAAAFLIGRFLVTEGHTEIGSPFNVTRSYETPLFNKEDMKELFGQFEADMRVKWNSNFQVDPAILDDIMAMTNGHPGLVNLCGRILAERVNRVHHAPSLEEWRDLMPFSTALQSYIKTANGQRMTHTLKSNSTALSLGLQLLRSQSVRVRDLPGDKDRTLEAAKQLVQEGIATFTDPTQKHIKLLCPINAALVRNVASTLYAASPPSLVNAQALTVPVLLRAMLPWLPGEILSHDLTRHKTNPTSSGHPTRGQRESVFRVQIGAQLTTLFENTSYKLVDDLPTSDGASRSIYPDIVICRDNEPLFVLELAVNMNLTWTLSPGKEMQKATLWYHLDKTAKYLERLKPREAWVVHFTTVPPSQFPGGKYPRSVYVPGAEHVQLMHVHYDEAWTQATMHLPDGTQDTFSLLPAPLSLAPFELESFLRDEAKIDADGVKEYVPLLRKNKVDEAGLHLLTDAMLRSWGIEAGLDRAKILAAAQKRTTGGQR